jgi:hypothetical protein
MNAFLLFVLLLIFIYEFIRRINYLEEKEKENEGFQDQIKYDYTYYPNNFSQEFERNINIKSIAKDLGVKRSINQVISSTDEPLPEEFYKPLDQKIFRTDNNRWTTQQRDWQESYTYLDDIIKQKQAINDYKNDKKNYDDLSIWERLDMKNGKKSDPEPLPLYIKSVDTINTESVDLSDLAMQDYNKWMADITRPTPRI